MPLGIAEDGIVQRHDDGTFTIVRPHANAGPVVEIEVSAELADRYRLWTGDVVEGEIDLLAEDAGAADAEAPVAAIAEPSHECVAAPRVARAKRSAGGLVSVARVNGLDGEGEAMERPSPRTRRSHFERTAPDQWTLLATRQDDLTGRLIDLVAPLGLGCMGIVRGAHGCGLTRTLRSVADGIAQHAPECALVIFLLDARGEEVTEWRRRYPQADVVLCPAAQGACPAEDAVRVAELVLEAAQRQTELGRDVAVLVDSLSGLWGAMLESEEADAQTEADHAQARLGIREFVQRAGCFHGEGLLGGGLGGSLTVIGTVWHQETDVDAEEEGEVHPHLRLLEHIVPEINWRVALSEDLARRRLYPAIDLKQCFSRHEEELLPGELMETMWAARRALSDGDEVLCHLRACDAIDATDDLESLAARLGKAAG